MSNSKGDRLRKLSAWFSKKSNPGPTLTEEELFKRLEDIWSKSPQTRYWTRSYENEFGTLKVYKPTFSKETP